MFVSSTRLFCHPLRVPCMICSMSLSEIPRASPMVMQPNFPLLFLSRAREMSASLVIPGHPMMVRQTSDRAVSDRASIAALLTVDMYDRSRSWILGHNSQSIVIDRSATVSCTNSSCSLVVASLLSVSASALSYDSVWFASSTFLLLFVSLGWHRAKLSHSRSEHRSASIH